MNKNSFKNIKMNSHVKQLSNSNINNIKESYKNFSIKDVKIQDIDSEKINNNKNSNNEIEKRILKGRTAVTFKINGENVNGSKKELQLKSVNNNIVNLNKKNIELNMDNKNIKTNNLKMKMKEEQLNISKSKLNNTKNTNKEDIFNTSDTEEIEESEISQLHDFKSEEYTTSEYSGYEEDEEDDEEDDATVILNERINKIKIFPKSGKKNDQDEKIKLNSLNVKKHKVLNCKSENKFENKVIDDEVSIDCDLDLADVNENVPKVSLPKLKTKKIIPQKYITQGNIIRKVTSKRLNASKKSKRIYMNDSHYKKKSSSKKGSTKKLKNSKNIINTSKIITEKKMIPIIPMIPIPSLLINDTKKSHNLQQIEHNKIFSEVLIDENGKEVVAEYILNNVNNSNSKNNSNKKIKPTTLKKSDQIKNHVICHDAHYINNDDEDV